MTFLADESVDKQIVQRLRIDGHKIAYIAEFESGISDELVLHHAEKNQSPLITADKDFGELVFRQHRTTHGVILLRLAGLSQEAKCDIVVSAFQSHGKELEGTFTVISPSSVRIRKIIQ